MFRPGQKVIATRTEGSRLRQGVEYTIKRAYAVTVVLEVGEATYYNWRFMDATDYRKMKDYDRLKEKVLELSAKLDFDSKDFQVWQTLDLGSTVRNYMEVMDFNMRQTATVLDVTTDYLMTIIDDQTLYTRNEVVKFRNIMRSTMLVRERFWDV